MRQRAKSVHERDKENSPPEIQRKRICFDEKNAQNTKRNSTSVPAKSILKQKPPSETDTSKSMTDIVATNCKLSNTLIDLTNKLTNKQNDYEKLLIRYFAEKKEKWFLQQKLVRRDDTIAELQRTLEGMNEARFCVDLIQIDGAVTAADNGKFPIQYYVHADLRARSEDICLLHSQLQD